MQETIPRKARKTPLLPPDFVRAMLAGHSALGIAFAALIYVVCLTGTLAVFLHELQRWEQPDAPIVAAPLRPDAVATALEQAYRKALERNAAHDLFIMGPGPVQSRVIVHAHDHDTNAHGDWIANGNGELVVESRAPWSTFVGDLHMNLHLPRTFGLFLVGLTGVALLSSLVSGLLSHPRLFKDAFAFRRGGSRRLEQADLHNRLGVWGLPFHVVVSTTGALLGLSTLIVGVLALAAYDGDSEKAFATILGPLASGDETAAPLPDIATMIRTIQAEHPEAEFANVNVQHIAKAGQIVHLGMRTPGHIALANSYYFDGAGQRLGDGGLETGSIGQQILGALQPLHFGWFGGFAVKIVYGILGLAITVVTQSGIAIWLARRRDSGRAAPHWEKVWAAVTWGQPLAIAVAALAIFSGYEPIALTAYLVTTVATLAAAPLTTEARSVTRTLRTLSGLAILAAVALHATASFAHATDPLFTRVAAAIALGGSLLAAPLIAPRLRRRAPE